MAAVVHDQSFSTPHLRLVPANPTAAGDPVLFWRRRITAVLVAAAMVWLVVSTAITLASWASGTGEPVFATDGGPVVHTVRAGETVWSVARQYQPDGDVRPFVDEIVELNGGSHIVTGQALILAQ